MADVIDDRLAGILGERHTVVSLALAADQDRARSPVDVVEFDRDNLRRTQTEAGKQQHHRIVPTTNGVCRSGGINEPLDLLRQQRPRQQ